MPDNKNVAVTVLEPDFCLVKFDDTLILRNELQNRFGAFYTVYLFDRNKKTKNIIGTDLYEIHPVYTSVEKDIPDEELESLSTYMLSKVTRFLASEIDEKEVIPAAILEFDHTDETYDTILARMIDHNKANPKF